MLNRTRQVLHIGLLDSESYDASADNLNGANWINRDRQLCPMCTPSFLSQAPHSTSDLDADMKTSNASTSAGGMDVRRRTGL